MSDCGVRFMNNNLITTTNSTVSSENSTYPFENALDTDRNKLFRFQGNFTIDSSNNKLYFDDGSAQTVTITAGSYTASSLASAIQSGMNAVSSNFTVSYAGNKFTIARTSTFQLTVSTQTNAIWDDIGFAGTDKTGAQTYTADEVRIHTEETVLIDLGVITEVQAILAVDVLNEIFTISSSSTVTIEANNVNVWTSPPLQESVTRTERGLFKHFSNDTNTYYRYWRLVIRDRLNDLGGDSIGFGYLYIGGADQLASTNIQRGFSRTRVDPSIITQSERGQKFSDLRTKYERFTNISVTNMDETDKDVIDENFEDFGLTDPFFISIDPMLVISSTEDEYTRLVRFSQNPAVTQLFLSYYQLGLAFEEVI